MGSYWQCIDQLSGLAPQVSDQADADLLLAGELSIRCHGEEEDEKQLGEGGRPDVEVKHHQLQQVLSPPLPFVRPPFFTSSSSSSSHPIHPITPLFFFFFVFLFKHFLESH